MRQLRAVVAGLMLIVLVPALPARGDEAAKRDDKLRQELLDRAEEDQKARRQLIDFMGRKGGKDAEAVKKDLEAVTKKLQEIDKRNTTWLKEVVDKRGWPGNALVGTDGAQRAWLLVQHADQDRVFQKRCLKLLAEAVKKGDASAEHLAYLTDRVRVGDNEKQVYGTQFREVNGKMEPYPIEDEANVDKRRKEAGLPPLTEYRKRLEEVYKPKDKGKSDK
jgi:hypothetical protein